MQVWMCLWVGEQGHLCIYLCILITCVSSDEEEEEEEEESASRDSHLQFKLAKLYYVEVKTGARL